ncbi:MULTISPECIES: hypothetical protein [unclassified Streptomyces]|uniref:hypothetical protein n=1 Tax=unclassified Streptomyces TaxID=2593676 RepID=UPI003716B538
MSLTLEIVLIVIGILLLAAALIGSGISRRLMTIPKMHRAPRIILALLGALLLVGGMWGVTTRTEKHGPTLATLRAHIPPDVQSGLTCKDASESPKGAVEMSCSADSVPYQAWYVMFPDVNSMQDYWINQAGPSDLAGSDCSTMQDYEKGSKVTYHFTGDSTTVGDQACYVSGKTTVAMYTDRRFNIVVWAQTDDPQRFAEFQKWVNNTSQPTPVGNEETTPPTPSHTVTPES